MSSSELGEAVVVSVTALKEIEPAYERSIARCIVSPAAIGLAPVPRRLKGCVRVSVPLAIVWVALVVLVKVA